MSAPAQDQPTAIGDETSSCGFSKPSFLMTNSLERGGTERQFVELASSLKASGCMVHLGCILRKGPFLHDLSRAGFAEPAQFSLGGSLYGVQSLKSRWRLRQHLRQLEIAVAHSFDFYVNLTLVPAAKLAGVPVIGSHRQLGDLLSPAQFRAQLEMFRWCDRVVCNSNAAADRLRQAGLQLSRIAVIGNGMGPPLFARATPVLSRSPGIVRVGMIGRMNIRAKNQDAFLRAAARVSRKFPECKFLLVGDGPLRRELEELAGDLEIQERVSFVGDRQDIPAMLASMDVSVVASASESLSNVMLESMAAGIPVVATEVGGNVELGAEGRAVLIPANNDEALAEAIEQLLGDEKLRREIATQARRFAEQNFSMRRIREQYCELYSQVSSA